MALTPKSLRPVDRHVVDILVAAVDEAGLTQQAIAAAAGMTQNRVGKILRGETPAPTIGELDGIAGVVGLRASEVIGRAERLAEADRYGLAASRHDLSRELPNQDEPA